MERFFTLNEINPKLKLLEENFSKIRQEFLDNFNRIYWHNWGYDTGYYGTSVKTYSEWKIAPIFLNPFSQKNLSDAQWKFMVNSSTLQNYQTLSKNFGESVIDYESRLLLHKRNSKFLPILTKTMKEICEIKRIGISMLNPQKEIPWHIDPDPETDNKLIIRGLWGLDVKEEENNECYMMLGNDIDSAEKRVFSNNQHMFFWGGVKHTVKNNLSTPRYCLCFDHEIGKDYLKSL